MQTFVYGVPYSVAHTRRWNLPKAFLIALGSPFGFAFFAALSPSAALWEKKGENLLTLPQRFVSLYNIHACFVKRYFVTFLCHMIPILKFYRHCLLSAFMEIAQCKVNTLYNQFVTAERTFFRNAVHIRKQIGSDSDGNNALL